MSLRKVPVHTCPVCGYMFWQTGKTPQHNEPNFGTSPMRQCPGVGRPGLKHV